MARGVRGKCPICLREVALLEDRSLRKHNRRASVRKGSEPDPCPGSGSQPIDQERLRT